MSRGTGSVRVASQGLSRRRLSRSDLPPNGSPRMDINSRHTHRKHSRHLKGDINYYFFPQEPNILAWIFEKFVIAMIIYFLLSIINSMAQHYAKRLDEKKRQSQKPAKGE